MSIEDKLWVRVPRGMQVNVEQVGNSVHVRFVLLDDYQAMLVADKLNYEIEKNGCFKIDCGPER